MKKVLSILVALTLIMSMAVSVSAFEGSIEVSLYIGNNVNWQTVGSDSVTVNAAGEYNLKLSGIEVDPAAVTVIYMKDAAVEADGDNHPKSDISGDIQIITKSLKINGAEVALDEGYLTTLNDAGAFDVCWYNIWATSYFSTLGMDTITEIEVTFEIVDGTADSAEAAPADETPVEPAPAENTPAAEAPVESAPSETTAPAAAPKPANTGVVLAVLPMAVAAAAVVISKKR